MATIYSQVSVQVQVLGPVSSFKSPVKVMVITTSATGFCSSFRSVHARRIQQPLVRMVSTRFFCICSSDTPLSSPFRRTQLHCLSLSKVLIFASRLCPHVHFPCFYLNFRTCLFPLSLLVFLLQIMGSMSLLHRQSHFISAQFCAICVY